ncbi:sodium/proton-translocating pyrophosphatase, partial [Candidatus Woesearchaeota archaeon]|nr:sodium/proton-translocating pyrophosphatase [Candidatus Woesearchaeota archaeon]
MGLAILSAVIVIAVLALLFVFLKFSNIKKADAGTPKMKEIADAVHEGAMAFLFREYRVLLLFVIIVGGVLWYYLNPLTAYSFLTGAILSVLAGFIGMKIATIANVRTTQAARKSLGGALKVAFSSGSVMGFSVVGFGLLGVAILYWLIGDPEVIIGFGFGASSVALFARVGGGIYTKAADVGADLVGKVEAGIPEDDPRNPATIADNVGDNVGDVAGMGADLFESYVGSILATMILALTIVGENTRFVLLPLMLAAAGIITSMIGTFLVRTKKEKNIHGALNIGLFTASILFVPLVYLITRYLMPQSFQLGGVTFTAMGIFYATVAGLVTGVLIGLVTEYYTAYEHRPTRKVSESSKTGAATNLIEGLALGMRSTVLPIIFIAIAIWVAYFFAGL